MIDEPVDRYEQRRVSTQPLCYNCQHGKPIEDSWEGFRFLYCMIDVPDSDIKHVCRLENEGLAKDERFCNIMKIKPGSDIVDSPRMVEPDEKCQFWEQDKEGKW